MREKRADDVGQVFFPLGIVGRQRCQRLDQRTGCKDVDPGIDLANGRGGGVCVQLLDNRSDLPRGLTNHPTVAGRIGNLGG